MKKWILLIVLLVVVIAAGSIGYKTLSSKQGEEAEENTAEAEAEAAEDEDAAEEVEDEDATPDFTVYDMDGNKVRLSDHFGKKILLNFWTTWCVPCQAEMPLLQATYEKYGDEIEFMFVNLTNNADDTEESVRKFIGDTGYTFPVYLDKDGEAMSAYGVSSIPTTFIIDEEGNVIADHLGSMNEEELNELLGL